MKILLTLIIIFSNYLFSKGQPPVDDGRLRPLEMNVVLRNFKPDRSPDFGIPLNMGGVVPGIMAPTLGENKRPQYCCGENPFLAPDGTVLVHNEESFNQWFDSDAKCTNYLLTFPLTLDAWDDEVQIGDAGPFAPTAGIGFGNPVDFPEYARDPFNQYYCFELHLSTVATDPDIDVFRFSAYSELWVYFNNSLVFDSGGDTQGFGASVNFEYKSIPTLNFDGTTVYPIDVYTCLRSTDNFPDGSPLNLLSQANLFCSWIDANGVCNGDNITAPCIDDPLSCVTKTPICGNCISGPRQCNGDPTMCTTPKCIEGQGCQMVDIDCSGEDVCIENVCDEQLGCIGNPIPNCYCNSTTCVTTDECLPRSCIDNQCIAIPVDCSIFLPNCEESFCNAGECICTVNPGTTEDVTSEVVTTDLPTITSTISVTTTSATTTSATTTGSETITSTGITTHFRPENHICSDDSCPHKYCCIQLKKSYTCVSKYFEDQCSPQILSDFF
ncbi:hypothetical protein DICPUDRAFT_55327 [Dictyostelium purpureum]|uniref:PA14 domain-containing protein n=1 Tax=Dictyostelium purpureum TaxID=5786 RepID=F0ZLL4_DICPU|nr:uncharacterized protein DICPUDRAFT_55327 [Dictyostelium purpureum]EGC35176.1 hypothetical protein DICPUDRAFT_55327 [Dictyostelium purpureum]|eukprot:XP_003288314.1 hypothetical protein DICPUDRAFT_55327 [Dictyostelium purpureum]